MPNLVEEKGGKRLLWEEQTSFFRKHECWGQQMGNKKVGDNISLCGCIWSFHLFHDHETPPDGEFILGLLLVFLLGVDANLKWEFMAVLIS